MSPPCTVEVSHGNDEAVSETEDFSLCMHVLVFQSFFFFISDLLLAGH